jgi:hypothetical protein
MPKPIRAKSPMRRRATGRRNMLFDALPSSIGYIKAGKLRPLAVTTATRSQFLPEIPTMGEFAPGYEVTGWNGIGAPENTPAEIVDKLNGEIKGPALIDLLAGQVQVMPRPTSNGCRPRPARPTACWRRPNGNMLRVRGRRRGFPSATTRRTCRHGNGADLAARRSIAGLGQSAACSDGHAYTAPGGTSLPNPFGLYDMHGNVRQWTQDCGHASYAGAPTDGSAWMSADCTTRIQRGGAWGYRPANLRSAYRDGIEPMLRRSFTCFRVARTL